MTLPKVLRTGLVPADGVARQNGEVLRDVREVVNALSVHLDQKLPSLAASIVALQDRVLALEAKVPGSCFVFRVATFTQTFAVAGTYYSLSGTLAESGVSDSRFAVGSPGITVTYSGATARLQVSVTSGITGTSGVYVVRFYVNGTYVNASAQFTVDAAAPEATLAIVGVVDVQDGDVVELRIANLYGTSSIGMNRTNAVFVVLPQ